MTTDQLVQKLKLQLKQLEQEVLQHDSRLPPGQRKMMQDVERFNNELFIQVGGQLQPCIDQLSKNITQLEQLLKAKRSPYTIVSSCEKIQDRFSALRRALSTTGINIKSIEQEKRSRRSYAIKRGIKSHNDSGFSWIASNVMQNSHQLYEELNKHLNWAKIIEQKIENLQSSLENCHSADKIKLQNEILSLHSRLGKCRQATSYIEDRIQLFERPFKSQNR
ncbi:MULTISPECIES: primosomal replication protein [unclassified Shewanella]|uniref:primosomal replication protein n=1 Tax=unclassified Shewanella TaxID=196818 RepID=UPI001BC30EA5|nr:MULTISPECIES: primosomal replication protein [unclassified Shewanella]GIU08213.1 primosomal protein N' [Shewanella sp. MBTL60-112-B1]GIU35095.1 primosomal protein N' [Shewanella sp. MBTL60-112-B2]